MNPQLAKLRKRILMFYFAGGANIVMAMLVFAAGAGTAGLVATLVFLCFAALQFYMGRSMQKHWDAIVRQQSPQSLDESR
jgi:VIT1/CCC1 family predicted Fe2+/Mn2+ transporter